MVEVIRHATSAAAEIARTPVGVLRSLARARSPAVRVGSGARDAAAPRASGRQPGRARGARCGCAARVGEPLHRVLVRGDPRPRPRRDLSGARGSDCRRPAASRAARRVRRAAHGRPRRSADGRRRHVRRSSGRRAAAGSRVVDSRLRSALLQDEADRRAATSTCRGCDGSSRCSSARRGADWLVTLDGNENFHDFAAFRAYWEAALAPSRRCAPLWPRVLVVEQPVHRDHAL